MKTSRKSAWHYVAALTLLMCSGRSYGSEPGNLQQDLRGETMGLALGAAPPPGVYFSNIAMLISPNVGKGQDAGTNISGVGDAATIVWSTGWTFLGGAYFPAITQPFYVFGGYPSANNFPITGGAGPVVFEEIVHNTYFNPINLSWNLGQGFHAAAGFGFFAPDGTRYNGSLNPDYWTWQPHAAVAYLANGWSVTGNLYYDFNEPSAGHTGNYQLGGFHGIPLLGLGDPGDGYRTGNQMFLDWSATRKFGKWEIGPIGYFKWQTTSDSPGGGWTCPGLTARLGAGLSCGRSTDYSVGVLAGYDFGPVSLQVLATDSFYTVDDFGGMTYWTRLGFKLGGS
jgi:hypothetical protein